MWKTGDEVALVDGSMPSACYGKSVQQSYLSSRAPLSTDRRPHCACLTLVLSPAMPSHGPAGGRIIPVKWLPPQ